MKIDFSPAPTAVPNAEIQKIRTKITARKQGFASYLDDTDDHAVSVAFAQEMQGKYDHIVVLGIGGSALGLRTLRDALLPPEERKKLRIIDTIDPAFLLEICAEINLKNTLCVVITKSGNTAETLSLYSYFKRAFEAENLPIQNHMIAITDPESGWLRQEATAEGLRTFPVPRNIGGRFSVLTAVGTIPAALAGIDTTNLINGARAVCDQYESNNVKQNTPFRMAQFMYESYRAGKATQVCMPYVKRLKTFTEWLAQLIAESSGKVDIHGKNVGITPIGALGVTDQHSQLQLFAQGPNDKHFLFISEESSPYIPIPSMPESDATTPLQGVHLAQLNATEMRATRETLHELGRPTALLSLPKIDAYSLGQLLFLFQGATAMLGEMMQIDAFNQPGVERSKVLTRTYLTHNE